MTGWLAWANKASEEYAAVSVFGAFLLYLSGYLSVRFHLTMLGVGTDLDVLDERYLFAGARFVTFTSAVVPVLVLLMLVAAIPLYALSAVRPIASWWPRVLRVLRTRVTPKRAALLGCVIATLSIQIVMRQCFGISDLLVGERHEAGWIADLQAAGPIARDLFFTAIVAATLATAAILRWTMKLQKEVTSAGALLPLLQLLLLIQVLLLPINYGTLIMDGELARVTAPPAVSASPGDPVWLVWETDKGKTYFVRGRPNRLVTVPRAEVKREEIIGYDAIESVVR
jgi:hypothetical protein